ncbi:MT-A70-domain-containing protein [Hyaloscypha bicolor E]|uniref:MT-A70-domain-containing protein n=1 Tax=Hyaloscypha bicolor E TaxID=1095630 RepID=A0A2J6SR88_9HELO|nr:MT-A70-domain-containing protein [Hyaloscypha bicolor E]PMD53287.1 MT-A70-domain-containing protein [Hyaloscypha bicolor E]
MASCILYQNLDSTVILIDIPRSIEEAQGDSSQRLLSSKPIEHPFPSVEPKSEKARKNLGELALEELILQKHIQLSLDQLSNEWSGEWCLPRGEEQREVAKSPETEESTDQDPNANPKDGTFFRNSTLKPTIIPVGKDAVQVPSNSTALCGDITSTTEIFISQAPKFDLIILDPPWPNRSARRKKSYGVSYGNHEIRSLLLSLPLTNNLTDDALVGVWVTNKPTFREMVLGERGLFEEWGVQLVEEWMWLKVTSTGEPISELSSMWRKPYEILLVGRRTISRNGDVKRRVLVGVPDLHSQKPNLKSIFEQVMKKEKYEALEVFARNLTVGWWGWGDEVLKFQSEEYWIEGEHLTQDIP